MKGLHTIKDVKAWLAFCGKCKGGILAEFVPMPKEFFCWNCGGPDIRKVSGAIISGHTISHA